MGDELAIWTVYDHPLDYPESFVVRRRLISRHRTETDATPTAVVATLEEARAAIPPGLACIPRHPGDDPVIVESWL